MNIGNLVRIQSHYESQASVYHNKIGMIVKKGEVTDLYTSYLIAFEDGVMWFSHRALELLEGDRQE